ncbi:hypothetical protein CDD80_3435 [Ophiocordyceps camponoti-rufipedis]|uniref:Uncharacterized protein n=1 Tax=Ophiocordyceps camponoti-rufipedis TaxID=2004952 RepID=A0A2C5Z2B2_9HYPO|nr:hypothetical protein CDD80_3435 [Ophiocordyceps camponoti-rufipedis]
MRLSPRLTRWGIPNPFTSPTTPHPPDDPARSSITSLEELTARTGHVAGSRLAPPIRTMRPSSFRRSRHLFQRESENIDVFADPLDLPRRDAYRDTSLTDMMEQAGLGDLRRGKPYVPGTTPRI